MKKILSFLLTLALLLSLTACQSGTPEQVTTQPTRNETTATTEASAPSATPPPTEAATTQPTTVSPPTVPPNTEPEPTPPPTTRPEPTQPPTTQPAPTTQPTEASTTEPEPTLDPYGTYTHRDDVALYIHLYGRLPNNFITKSQARALGWSSGSLERYAPGKCIGGDRFYNREGLLPAGRTYTECDIDTLGKSSRGAKRIVFSNDGLIYYTSDHYASFTLLYGEP